jgi:murein DD-endopeptidase MepM/ murein hydrolase activator NlpD
MIRTIRSFSIVFLILLTAISSSLPVHAFSDFYSDSEIQFIDLNACDPSGQSNPPTDSSQDSTTVGTNDDTSTNVSDTTTGDTTPACTCAADINSNVDISGNTNAETAFNFFVNAGFSKEQSAGIVGNLLVESGLQPQRQQGTASGKITPADSWSGAGWGIAQWTPGSKFIDPIKASGKNPNDLLVQLKVIADGLEGNGPLAEPVAGQQLKTTTTVEQAAEAFQGSVNGNPYFGYERPQSRTASIGARISKAKAVLKKFGANAPSSVVTAPDSGVDTSDSCSGASDAGQTGSVNADGYSFPIDLPKDRVTNWGNPWCQHSCHHDGTPAMDITKIGFGDSVVGTSEFAIVDGKISNLHIYNGIEGCYSLQLIGKDGWVYYYTHMRKPVVQSGDKVKAGDKVAEVGERKCTGNGSDPHLHIDRGSPKGHMGGQECCRDKGFENLMDTLYDNLGVPAADVTNS